MVSKKRLDYGFNDFRVPVIPRAPRSIRRKRSHKKLVEDNQPFPLELLANLAGKLLQESESIAIEKGQPKDDKDLKSECFDPGSCAKSLEISFQERNLLSNLDENNPFFSEQTSVHESSDSLKKVHGDINLGISEDKNQMGDLSIPNQSGIKDPMGECVNTNLLINSDSSIQLPLYRDPISGALLRKHSSDVKLGSRDDDEKSFGCNNIRTVIRYTGHRRIRKMLTSNYRKVAPNRNCELYRSGEGVRSFYRYRKNNYARERCQRALIKKRKLFDHSFPVPYDDEGSSESISNLPENEIFQRRHQKTDSRVKFSIKSFRVPELYVEVPETATVGFLKKTVMEAVNALLGGGLQLGLVLQGKKFMEEHRTLKQAGISQSNKLGFTLEPSSTHVSPSMSPKKRPRIFLCDADNQLQSSPATPNYDSGISNISVDPPLVTKLDDDVDNSELIPSPTDALTDGAVSNSMALVPTNPNVKGSEISQRRIRRPFSVTEVEALVEAVEKIGTGRWRDVKMRAFENADHRTYVDLKDKWKTLVHTATISPQQRRGEPVPQELLNRVLSAHGYWVKNQSKLN